MVKPSVLTGLEPSFGANADFALGEHGWIVLAHNAQGVRWEVGEQQLVVDGTDAVCGPSGSIVVFSPRAAAQAGEWVAEAVVRCTPPALVDIAVVAGEVVPVPGPAPTPAPYEVAEADPSGCRVSARRVLGAAAQTVGLRLRAPAGCRLEVVETSVRPVSDLTPRGLLEVGFRGARGPFRDGALLSRGEAAAIEVAVRGQGTASLCVSLEDRYRGTVQELMRAELVLDGSVQWLPVELPTDRNGSYAVLAVLEGQHGRAESVFRIAVDDDATPLGIVEGPWALTIDTLSLDVEAQLLDLLGIAHVRVYSGFGVYDLPAVLDVDDPAIAAAVVDGLHFIGVAAGTPAAVNARATAGIGPGRPREGWPAWRTASAALAHAERDQLAPVAQLLDPLAGRTLVAEMSQLDDPDAYQRVVAAIAGGASGRDITWLAGNEPDLWNDDSTPERSAAQSAAFAAGVRAADPTAHLVGPAIADGWDGRHQGMLGWEWLERWVRAGGADAVDAVSVHLHMLDEETQTPERELLGPRLEALREQLAMWSGRALPLWVTEMGWRSLPDPVDAREPGESGPAVSEADQADLLVRAAVTAAAAGVERFYAFHLTGFRPTGEGHRFAWGLLSGHVGGPKPAFAALRALVRSTRGRAVAVPLSTSTRVRAVPFLAAADGIDLHVVWQWTGGPGLWSLLPRPVGVTVTDLLGEPAVGDDLRRPHLVRSPAAERRAVQRWLEERLAPRFGEPAYPESQPAPPMEELHVTTA